MNNSEYWARRFKLMEDALQDEAYDYVQNLERRFNAAIRDLNTQMRAWYQRFADNNGISYAEAKKLLKSDELEEFSWTVQEYIEKGRTLGLSDEWVKALENASARVHISRLDALKYQLRQLAEELTQERIKNTTDAAKLAYTQSYYHTAFEIQRGFGVGWTMQVLDDRVIEKVLSRPWTADNQTFTARCWADKAKLVETVNRELTRMVATGASPDKAIERIAKQFKTSKSNAGRVVMTESAYFASAGQKDCYNELDVEQYRVSAARDTLVCDICGDMDGRVYKTSEFVVGSTAPPFHPWCRCGTEPYFPDMEGIGERYARDVETGKSYMIPKDITYKEWKAQQDAAHGAGTVDRKRKMRYNKSADKAQFERYKALLGDKAPETFEAFQEVKYSDGFASLKVQYADARIQSRIKNGKVNITVLAGKQGKHIKGHNNFIEGRSYLNAAEDVQALVNKYAGTGTLLRDASGKWAHKEVVKAEHPIGFAVSQVDGTATTTATFTIHYSKNGVHIVPKRE